MCLSGRLTSAQGHATLLGLALVAGGRLAANGQLDAERWSPLFNPADQVFGQVWALLGEGIARTLLGAGLVIAFSLVIHPLRDRLAAPRPVGGGLRPGMTRGQALRRVLLPHAFRVMLPALISQMVVALKDTSLGFVIQWQETVRTANILNQTLRNPIQMFLLVGALFVLADHLLSKLAEHVERRLSRGPRGGNPARRAG